VSKKQPNQIFAFKDTFTGKFPEWVNDIDDI
jgi:hypothetical protein